MASPYAASSPGAWQSELRSVTPATNNRQQQQQQQRFASAPRMGGAPYNNNMHADTYRSITPNRMGYHHSHDMEEPRTPSSTGLIRLTLKKPMGIVFEPMYDPNQPSTQRGVRICDLPRTGAAALSRKLQVGDELLQINDTTVSRLSFDEIMDFIIDADPESVNLLFRRPRKETLQARQGVQQKLNAAANKDNPSTVKWVDEEGTRGSEKKKDRKNDKRREKKSSKRSKKEAASEEDTLQSSTAGDESYVKKSSSRSRKKKSRKDPYESESFLDLLIDTICSNSSNVCRDTFRRNDDDYFSDEESFGSEAEDESTYITYDESLEPRAASKSRKKEHVSDYEETEDDTMMDHRRNKRKEKVEKPKSKKYEDDASDTIDSGDRIDKIAPMPAPVKASAPPVLAQVTGLLSPPAEADEVNPAPIREVEYDDRFDPGADVSVMESLGGPSLLIERQRAAAHAASQKTHPVVPAEIVENFGLDYPATYGMTRVQTIEADPVKFYTYVVKELLAEHEPEKVRLLDKLLAKYKGREDHLVQKLSVRYNATGVEGDVIPEEQDDVAFSDAVKKTKTSSDVEAAVNTARERMHSAEIEPEVENPANEWPEKEEKVPDAIDEEEESRSGSDYSGDSVDGTSPAVIAQVSELLNYVYGKTSVPGQIDRVSTIMRAYEGREAVLLELLETKALMKANKEKENTENLPSFLRNSTQVAQKNAEELGDRELPPVTPMATQPQQGTAINDDISSMSGVSSPAPERDPSGVVNAEEPVSRDDRLGQVEGFADPVYEQTEEVEVTHLQSRKDNATIPKTEAPKINATQSMKQSSRPPATPDKKKKKGLFGGLFGGKKKKENSGTMTPGRAGSRSRNRKLRGVTSVEGSI